MKPKGGLPAFVNLQPTLGLVQPVWDSGRHWNRLSKLTSGDVVSDENILDDIHSKLGDKLFFSTLRVHLPRKGFPNVRHRISFEPDTFNPYKVYVSLEVNIDCTLYLTNNLMESRRLWVGQPWFINSYHRFYFDRPVLTDAIILEFDCDEKLRETVLHGWTI